MCIERRQRGLTLIELIVFIVIVGVALAGILAVMNVTMKSSSDPLIRKQMLAIAESLMTEVQMQAHTWCDPNDAAAATATAAADCTGGAGGANDETNATLGPETGEVRGSNTSPYDNVNDYNGRASIVSGLTGTAFPSGYSASISVAQAALGDLAASSASLLITVTVSHGSQSLTLHGYRARFAPNHTP